VTGKDADTDRFWAQKQGCSGYVVKPFTAEQLAGAIQPFV